MTERSEVTYKELGIFIKTATGYLNSHHEQNVLFTALTRLVRNYKARSEAFDDKINLQRIRLAIKDTTGHKAVIMKDNQYQYTEENLIKLEEYVIAEQNKTLSIKPIYTEEAELPKDFMYTWRSAFEKFAVKVDQTADDLEEQKGTVTVFNGAERELKPVE